MNVTLVSTIDDRACDGLRVTIPGALASGAHQLGEESALIVYVAARALDVAGSGRVTRTAVLEVCAALFSRKQLQRTLVSGPGERYWELEPHFLRLLSVAAIVCSYHCPVLGSVVAARFPLALLDTRQRRGAALLAAVLTGIEVPRANQFISRFAGVDRKTVSRWMKDPVIAKQILLRVPQWAEL